MVEKENAAVDEVATVELCGGGVAGVWGLGLRSERRGFDLGFMNCDGGESNCNKTASFCRNFKKKIFNIHFNFLKKIILNSIYFYVKFETFT